MRKVEVTTTIQPASAKIIAAFTDAAMVGMLKEYLRIS
jgi:hypothetical protein